MNTKQVIVIRKDLKMRLGKSVAQGAHASLMAYCNSNPRNEVFKLWNDPINGYRKITLGVNSEEELWAIYHKSKSIGLVVAIVRDLGLTEFKEPTYTALAIGPHWDEDIDSITSSLSLL